MSDLAEFLLARIAEDEAVARAASGGTVVGEACNWRPAPGGDEWAVSEVRSGPETEVLVALRPGLPRPPDVMGGYWGQVIEWDDEDGDRLPTARHIARHDPARVLAECEAKRRIMDRYMRLHESAQTGGRAGRLTPEFAERHTLGSVVNSLALPYADHPDYREAWRP